MLKGASLLVVLMCVILSTQALAWGHRGHEIVASVAARLLVEKEKMDYLRDNEFSLGYYANVPDMIWKNLGEETYKTERPQHYFDWYDKYEKIFSSPRNLPENLADFKAKMGADFDPMDGYSPWRIKQFFENCQALAKDLTFQKQGPLLVCAGEMSHYIGDLSQPLHVTNNYDGQLTKQKGVHAYFEETVVNFLDPQLKVAVLAAALKKYPQEAKKNRQYSVVVRDLIAESNAQVGKLLAMDKKFGRELSERNARKYQVFITEALARGAVATALVWKEFFKDVKSFNNEKFYDFVAKPEYVQPEK